MAEALIRLDAIWFARAQIRGGRPLSPARAPERLLVLRRSEPANLVPMNPPMLSLKLLIVCSTGAAVAASMSIGRGRLRPVVRAECCVERPLAPALKHGLECILGRCPSLGMGLDVSNGSCFKSGSQRGILQAFKGAVVTGSLSVRSNARVFNNELRKALQARRRWFVKGGLTQRARCAGCGHVLM